MDIPCHRISGALSQHAECVLTYVHLKRTRNEAAFLGRSKKYFKQAVDTALRDVTIHP